MFDLIVLAVLVISALVGFVRGATRELVAVLSFVIGVVAAILALPMVLPAILKVVETDWLAKAMALLFVFLAVFIVLRVVGGLLTRKIHTTQLGPIDRAIGLGFGLIRALIVLGVFNIVFHVATPPERTPTWVINARLYPLTVFCADALQSLAPKGSAVAEKVAPALERSLRDSGERSPDSQGDKRTEGVYDPAASKQLDDLVEKSR